MKKKLNFFGSKFSQLPETWFLDNYSVILEPRGLARVFSSGFFLLLAGLHEAGKNSVDSSKRFGFFGCVIVSKLRWVLNGRSSISVTGAKLHSNRLSRKRVLLELAISRSPFTQVELWNAINKFPGSLNDLLALSRQIIDKLYRKSLRVFTCKAINSATFLSPTTWFACDFLLKVR